MPVPTVCWEGGLDGACKMIDQTLLPGELKIVDVTTVEAMHDAAEVYSDNQDAAVTVVSAALERFKSDAEALHDPALTPESELATDLLQLMQAGAEQGDLYGFDGQP